MGKEIVRPQPSENRRFAIEAAAATHVGLIRRINEDSVLERGEIGLWAVADGVGGGEAGNRASALITERLGRIAAPSSREGFAAAVKGALAEVNRQLLREAAALYRGCVIASTVVALLVFDRCFCCLWAGDSRLYRLRSGRLERLTRDHSEVERLLDRGLIRPEEARQHPLANVITRAVGVETVLELDRVEGAIAPGDVFLLCTDGLTRVVEECEIERALIGRSATELVRVLIEWTLAGGAPDNVSVVAVKVAPREGEKP